MEGMSCYTAPLLLNGDNGFHHHDQDNRVGMLASAIDPP